MRNLQWKRRGRRSVLVGAVALALGCSKSSDDTGGKAQANADSPVEAEGADADAKAAALPAAESLLEKSVEAAGGRDALDRVHSFHYTSHISVAGQNIAGDVEIWWKDGDFYTEQELVGIGQIRAGKQGDEIWSKDPINGLRKLDGAEAEQHAWASSLMLAADWKRYFSKAETIGEREADGKTVYDVKLTSDSGATVTLGFDGETGLQVGQSFEQVTPMGGMPISLRMEDYRDVEGIKIPFKQVTDASLAKATQEIKIIELNAEVDTSRFSMPTAGAEVVSEKDLKPLGAPGEGAAPPPAQ